MYIREEKYDRNPASFTLLFLALQITSIPVFFPYSVSFPSDFVCHFALHIFSFCYNSDFSLNQIWLHSSPSCDNLLLQIDPTSWPTLLSAPIWIYCCD